MPGLGQLKKFNSDILSLGNEPELRSKRGEKVSSLPIPKNIDDIDDSDDFVMGMPEIDEASIAENDNLTPLDEDLSDITGVANNNASVSSTDNDDEKNSVNVPDLSSLVNSVDSISNESSEDNSIPDLSMFMDTPKEDEPIVEEKKPEISDLSLEDLLGGEGFDGSAGTEETSIVNENEDENEEINKSKDTDDNGSNIDTVSSLPDENINDVDDNNKESDSLESLDEIDSSVDDVMPGESFSADDIASLSNSEDEGETNHEDDKLVQNEEQSNKSDIDKNTIEDTLNQTSLDTEKDFTEPSVLDDSVNSDVNTSTDNQNFDNSKTSFSADDFDLSNISDSDFDIDNFTSGEDGLELPEVDNSSNGEAQTESNKSDKEDSEKNQSNEKIENENEAASESDSDNENFEEPLNLTPDFESDDNTDFEDVEKKTDEIEDNPPQGLFDSSDLDIPISDETENPEESFERKAEENDEFKTSDFGKKDDFDISQLDVPDFDTDESKKEDEKSDDFPKDFDFNIDETDSLYNNSNEEKAPEESVSTESFDVSAMEGLEFPDTDTQLASNSANDFELGNDSEIQMENSDFEIPGYSDVDTVTDSKNIKKEPNKKDESDKKEAIDEDIPSNTLSDAQYEKFIKNLSSYPLNVRVAVEDLIVKNEFTDEAEFEIIQKVLKKVPARQLASELEKMLDIALPVPRDFESRTSEEYEAYKSSFQYQLKNKIIPGSILCVAATFLCLLFFIFIKNFIYKPARATSLYKEGYELLSNDDYPQSEIKFNEATLYDLQKKWFFKYAQGYRSRKQYVRAEKMYKNILYCFNHDKQAGLEYADMQLTDLANYEKAENILLRDVLDYHINDKNGILQLGDTYLEWATEKDSSKFEEARVRYSELIQLYGSTALYESRMMRYFIRTDNLLDVLQLKERFMPREKSLGAQGWTELSGFLLDKLYGYLPPADEYLRNKIEDVKEILMRAVRADSSNPIALYNLSRYYVQMNNNMNAKSTLEQTLKAFDKVSSLKKKDMYKYIDSYRLLGERYLNEKEYLKSREIFTAGISLFKTEEDERGFVGNNLVGKLYSDMGNLDYFIAGDVNSALINYQSSVDNDNDIAEIRYKIGAIQYNKKNYSEALGSFMKASEEYPDDINLLLAMGNTLALRNDTYASQGYYERMLDILNTRKEQQGILFPQVHSDDADIVDAFLKASNNLGVVLYKLSRRTGNSNLNAQAISNFQDSLRAWDSLTRNQQTLVRLSGSNLAEQNIKYLIQPTSDFEPAIYTELSRTLEIEEGLKP